MNGPSRGWYIVLQQAEALKAHCMGKKMSKTYIRWDSIRERWRAWVRCIPIVTLTANAICSPSKINLSTCVQGQAFASSIFPVLSRTRAATTMIISGEMQAQHL